MGEGAVMDAVVVTEVVAGADSKMENVITVASGIISQETIGGQEEVLGMTRMIVKMGVEKPFRE